MYTFKERINDPLGVIGKSLTLSEEKEPSLLGIEVEFMFSPHTQTMRDTLQLLHEDGVIVKAKNNQYQLSINNELFTGSNILYQAAFKLINEQFGELFFKPAHKEESLGKSLEISFKPASILWLVNNRLVIDEIFTKLRDLGFIPTPECGMHLWIDYSFLGDNTTEVVTTIENFLWFSIRETRFLHNLTKRVGISSINSDMYHFLGDTYGEVSDLLTIFKKEKKSLLGILTDNGLKKETSLFNIVFSKEGTQALEFRWFSSVSSYIHLIKNIHELLNLFIYCKALGKDNEHLISYYDYNKFTENANYKDGLVNEKTSKTVKL